MGPRWPTGSTVRHANSDTKTNLMDEPLPLNAEFFAANLILFAIGGAVLLFFALAWCRIFGKAGYKSVTGLLMLVPGVNLVMLCVLAFTTWPINREVKTLRGIKETLRRSDHQDLRRAS